MTLGITIIFRDGIIIASDSQATAPAIAMKRYGESKIHKINDKTLMVGAGSVAFIQYLEEHIENHKNTGIIKNDLTAKTLKQVMSRTIVDIRSEYIEQSEKLKLSFDDVPSINVILGSYNGRPEVYFIDTNGFCERIDKYETIGSSKWYAETTLAHQYKENIDENQAKELAFWILKQCSALDPYVGPPFIIKVIKRDGSIDDVTDAEMEHMRETFDIKASFFKDLFHISKGQIPAILKLLEDVKENETPKTDKK